jgi:hypothetical protein
MLPARGSGELSAGGFAALFVAAFAVASAPLLWVTLPPLVDYPNHLARMHIIAAGAASPALREFYAITWRPIPDLAMDLVVPLLARAMPLLWAGKVFLLLTFLLLAGGTALLHRALFRRWSAWPCLAFLLLYSRTLLWGFANFLFGVGLALVGAAAWVRLREGPAAARHAVAVLFALAIYLSHLFAFGAYALVVLGYEVAALRQERRLLTAAGLRDLAAAAGQFVLPALLFLAAAAHGGGTGVILYSHFSRKFDLFFSVLDDYVRWFDGASFALLVLLFAVGAWRGAIALRRGMGLPLLLLLLAQIAMPNRILGAAGVDHRMPLILALVLVAATDGLAASRRLRRLIGIGLALLFLVRMAVVAAVWTESDRAYTPLARALTMLPPGSKLAVGYPPGAVNVSNRHPPTVHLAGLAVIGADAFVPTLFAYPGQQPLSLRPRFAALAAAVSPGDFWAVLVEGRPDDGRVARALAQYDFILLAGDGPFQPQAGAPLAPRAAGAGARLYAVVPRSLNGVVPSGSPADRQGGRG